MQLANAEKVHDFSIEIIQHFDRRRVFVEEHLGPSGEGFDIRRVLRKERNDLFGKRSLAADIRERTDHGDEGKGSDGCEWRFDSTFRDRSVVSSYAIGEE
jgi:hypothetical protein